MEDCQAVAVVQAGDSQIAEYAPIPDILGQVQYLHSIFEQVMQEDHHYGVIPGTPKPSLWKPGAEKLCFAARLYPDFEEIEVIHETGHTYYRIRCTLRSIITGNIMGSGIGSCSSMEDKHRWRNIETDEPVPKEYWAARSNGDRKKMKELLGDGVPKKAGGQWVIARRMENDNPWNLDNTISKMAQKRALVAATLVATAASDIFTQDLEDMPDIAFEEAEVEPKTESNPEPPPEPKRTKGGALQDDYAKAVELFKNASYKAAQVNEFLVAAGYDIEGHAKPLSTLIDEVGMKAILENGIPELKEIET